MHIWFIHHESEWQLVGAGRRGLVDRRGQRNGVRSLAVMGERRYEVQPSETDNTSAQSRENPRRGGEDEGE